MASGTMKTCDTCKANKICDHNKYGFENCGNYIPTDVVPRAEVARELFAEIENIARTVGFPETLVNGMIVNRILDGLHIDSQDFAVLKKKYTGEER